MQDITAAEVRRRLEAGEKLHLLDVREPSEYADYNIRAKLIPLGDVMAMQLDDIEDWKDQEVIIHCHAGKRSMQAGLMLETMGFTNVKNMVGGMLAWQQDEGGQ